MGGCEEVSHRLATYQNEFHEFQQQQPHLRKKAESVNLFYQPKKMDSPRK
jgi:hypothetical protein